MRKAARAKPKGASKVRLAARAKKPARIELAAECTLRDAATLQALLVDTVSATDEVIVAAGAVTRIDAAALQLLVAFAQREAAAGRRVVWQDPSADFVESGARLGLAGILGLDVAGGAA